MKLKAKRRLKFTKPLLETVYYHRHGRKFGNNISIEVKKKEKVKL